VYIKLSPEILAGMLRNEKNKRPLIAGLSNEYLLVFINKNLKERERYYLLADFQYDANNLVDLDFLSI
jgi:hypothetical protein